MGTKRKADIPGVLFGKTRRQLLAVLYGNPAKTLYLRELARLTSSGQGAVQRELDNLVRAGIVSRSRQGNQVYFQANRGCPIFNELQQLLVKTAGVGDELRRALSDLRGSIRSAFVFGSFASGEYGPSSDVDLMIVGEVDFAEVVAALAEPQRKLNREINPSVYPRREFVAKFRAGQPFLRGVVAGPKIFVIGEDCELEGLVAKRLAG